MIRFLSFLSTFGLIALANAQDSSIDHYETVVYAQDDWNYYVANSEPDSNWTQLSYDDSQWLEGPGGIGYGDGDDNTIIEQTTSLYLRIKFTIIDTSAIKSVLLHIDYDDAFVAYINGMEVARSGITGKPPAFNELGTNHEAKMWNGGLPEQFLLSEDSGYEMYEGDNVLAIQVHNSSVSSSDMSAIPFLSLGLSTVAQFYGPTPEWFIEPLNFTSSNLPIILIETLNNGNIPDEPKIKANMKIIHKGTGEKNKISDPGNVYNGNIGIEIRGAYSASLPQKPFGIETRDSDEENLNVPLLGMPKENDWILLANYNDKTFMRNSLAFHLFREMGHYAPRTEFCEVTVNGSYEGIYVFTEKIKRDKGRVDIAKLDADDNAGDSLTGGYIFKIDYFNNFDSWRGTFSPVNDKGAEVNYVYSDPKPDELTSQQKTYLKDYIEEFESKLYGASWQHPEIGYASYVDIGSFIDYFLISELSRNVDAYKKSRYYFKDKNSKGGLIHSGPVWDFDWAWKTLPGTGCPLFNSTQGAGWAYKVSICDPWPSPSGWMVRFMQDPYFKQSVANRYWDLRKTILSNEYLNNYIDSVHLIVNEAQYRHYMRWPILGINVGTPEVGDQPLDYAGEVIKFKEWIRIRLSWLDQNMPEENDLPSPFIRGDGTIRIYPNPAREKIQLESEHLMREIEVYNSQGMLVDKHYVNDVYTYRMDLHSYNQGIYFIRVAFINKEKISLKLLVN